MVPFEHYGLGMDMTLEMLQSLVCMFCTHGLNHAQCFLFFSYFPYEQCDIEGCSGLD